MNFKRDYKRASLAISGFWLFILMSGNPAIAKSMKTELADAFTQQSLRYNAEEVEARSSATAALDKFDAALSSGSPSAKYAFNDLLIAFDKLGYILGEKASLKDAMDFLAKKHSSREYQYWADDHVRQAKDISDQALADNQAAQGLVVGQSGVTVAQAAAAGYKAAMSNGYARGVLNSLAAADRNLFSYYMERDARAAQGRAAFAQALQNIGQSFQQSGSQIPMPAPPIHTNCQTYGNRTNCLSQ